MPVKSCTDKGMSGFQWGDSGKYKNMYNNCFENLDSYEKSYWFGFLIGDGSIGIYGRSKKLSITLKKGDVYHLIEFTKFIGYNSDRVKYRKDGKTVGLQIVSEKLFYDLYNLGMRQRKANTVNGSVFPNLFQFDFIRGLIDADGSIVLYKQEGRYVPKVSLSLYGNLPLLKKVHSFIDSGGHLIENKSRDGRADCLVYNGRFGVEHVLNLIYENDEPSLGRKIERYLEIVALNKKVGFKCRVNKKYDIYINSRPYANVQCFYCGKSKLKRIDHILRSEKLFCSSKCYGLSKRFI